ncbi:MAG: hypothetical protein ACTSWN_12775, partial [Promethearchaeota archaeon]
MSKPELKKTIELNESILSLRWNGDNTDSLISVIVEGSSDLLVYDGGGDLVHELKGHATSIEHQAWLTTHQICTVSANGELRVWELRGKKFDCVKFKREFRDVQALASLVPPKRFKNRFLVFLKNDTLILVENNEIRREIELPTAGRVLYSIQSGEDVILALDLDNYLEIVFMDGDLSTKKQVTIKEIEGPRLARLVQLGGNGVGIFAVNKEQKIAAFNLDKKERHRLKIDDDISCLAVDMESRTLFAGNMKGGVKSIGFDLGVGSFSYLGEFAAHDFKITALDYTPRDQYLITGSFDGVINFWMLPQSMINKIKEKIPSSELDWREREKFEKKYHLLQSLIAKNQLDKALRVLDDLKSNVLRGYERKIEQLTIDLARKQKALKEEQALKTKVIRFLNEVSEDRGDILLDEIVKALDIAKEKIINIIRKAEEEMEWEFVEKYDCLFLFNRTASIAGISKIEQEIARSSRSRQKYRREPSRRYERGNRQRHGTRGPRLMTPATDSRLKRLDLPPREFSLVENTIRSITDRMSAVVIDKNGKVSKRLNVVELIPFLERENVKSKFIIMDGIISPRLLNVAEKLNIEMIFGRRIHPRVDIESSKVKCFEFEDLEAIKRNRQVKMKSAAVSDGKSQQLLSPAEIERKLMDIMTEDKWEKLDVILEKAGIKKGSMDWTLANVKLRQLVDAGKIEKEIYKNIQYF